MKSDNDLLITLLIVGLIFFLFTPSSSSDIKEKTVYLSYCSDFKHNSFSCPKDEHIVTNKTIFKIFPREQRVVSNSYLVNKLDDCVIFDEDNWSCRNGEFSQSIKDGNYRSHSDGESIYQSIDENGKQSVLPLGNQMYSSAYYVRNIINFLRSL